MRLLFIGDVVGRSGRKAVEAHLQRVRDKVGADFVVLNGENAAGGFGITEAIFNEFRDQGPTSSRWATMPGTSARRLSSSSARRS
jgi:calcineurin-like phosphoesterase